MKGVSNRIEPSRLPFSVVQGSIHTNDNNDYHERCFRGNK